MSNTNGAANRHISLDIIEETLREPGKRGARSRRLGVDVLDRQLRQCEKLRVQFDRLIKRAIFDDSRWIPPLELVKAIAENASTTKGLLDALRNIRKAEADARGKLTDEQLEAVLVAELHRMAHELSPKDAHTFVATRYGKNIADRLEPDAIPPPAQDPVPVT